MMISILNFTKKKKNFGTKTIRTTTKTIIIWWKINIFRETFYFLYIFFCIILIKFSPREICAHIAPSSTLFLIYPPYCGNTICYIYITRRWLVSYTSAYAGYRLACASTLVFIDVWIGWLCECMCFKQYT